MLDVEENDIDWDIRYSYEYDEANQLVRVDDNVEKKTYTYQYDKGGNRVSEKIYPYTESAQLGTPEKTIKSEYNFLQWKDRLSSYDGKAITYDSAGNPTSYGDQKYVWNGKQLIEIVNPDGTKTTFAYDADGFRTEKHQFTADGREEYVVYYIWLNGILTQQYLLYNLAVTIKGETRYIQLPFFAEFLYDESNQAQGCIINGDGGYLFVRNLQGDVFALTDMEGNVVIEYNYDPWGRISYTAYDENGNPTTEMTDETLKLVTAIFCPLTYRGYNYDFTTGLYYLQSRYYNPDWGRFLNVDDTSILLATQGETHGANLFAYCNNNPVNKMDPTGFSPDSAFICELVNLLIVFRAIDMAFGHKLMEVFPCYNYFDMTNRTVEKTLRFISFNYVHNSNSTASVILIKGVFQTEIGIKYFEGEIEVHSISDWMNISYGGFLGNSLTKFDNEFYGLSYGLSEVLPSPWLESFTAFEFARSVAGIAVASTKRGKYIRWEVERQKNKFGSDTACILNWYCTYQRKRFNGKNQPINYIEHDCAKEFKG